LYSAQIQASSSQRRWPLEPLEKLAIATHCHLRQPSVMTVVLHFN